MKILLTFILATALIATPTFAATGMNADELRAEIARLSRVAESIRAQLLKFGSDPSTVQPGSTSPNPSDAYSGAACLRSNLQMRKGHQGGSVNTLQQFLVQEGVYSSSLVTGYYGPATEAGVKRWQASHGVISYGTPATTGYGKVGPSTLRAMHAKCPGGAYTGQSGSLTRNTPSNSAGGSKPPVSSVASVERYTLSMNPTRGLAPLSVTAEFSIAGSTCTSYVLDWGDGSLPISYNSNKSTDCNPLQIQITRTHIYTSGGEHIVRFKNGKAPVTKIREVSQLKVKVLGVPSVGY